MGIKTSGGITHCLVHPFLSFSLYSALPRANHAKKILQIELSYINSPSQVQLQESGASHKTNQASAYNRYSTSLSHDEIFDYYDDELARHGWRYLGQHNITLEAVGRNYCKGNYTASLDYYGFGYTWKYELWLSAGQTSDCEMLKGGGFAFIPFSDLWFLLACSVSWSIYAVIIGWASCRMTQKEFMQFMGNIVKSSTGVWRSKPDWHSVECL